MLSGLQRVYCQRNFVADGIDLTLIRRFSDASKMVATSRWQEILDRDGVLEPLPPTMTLQQDEAQNLIDELWNCGIRPTEGSGSAGSLAATERHLTDMQKFANRLLDAILATQSSKLGA